MKSNDAILGVLAVGGLGLAWYALTRRPTSATSQTPLQVLPSRQIGNGFIGPIVGGHGMAPVYVDPVSGDTSAPLGTDQILAAIDPLDPSIYGAPQWDVSIPDLSSGASSGIDFAALHEELGY